MMKNVIWGLLIVSSAGLLYQLLKQKQVTRAITFFSIHAVVGMFAIYILNLFTIYTHFSLPINPATVSTIGVLGVPGLLLISALKIVLV
jgi:inhibitor of the pro-sigma K processing machinery